MYLAIAVGNRPFRQIDSKGFQYFGYVYINNWKKINPALLTQGARKYICIIGFQFATSMGRNSSTGNLKVSFTVTYFLVYF